MTEQTTPDVSLAEMSLADYRAQRENPAATPAVEDAEAKPTAGSDAGESDAREGGAEDTTEHDAEETATEKKPAKKGGFQRKLEQREREIEDLKRQLAEKSAGKPAEEKSESKPAVEAPQFDKAKPKLEDFDSIEAYSEALSDWKADERDFKREQAAKQQEAQKKQKQIIDEWNTRQAAAKKTHADYDDVLESVSDLALSPAHQAIFLESEHGPELAYQLAKNRDELTKFASLTPLAAARYFGKLEAGFSDDAPEPKEKVSNAPKPFRPVGGRGSTAAGHFDLATASLADYRKAREAGKIR